MWYTVQAKPAPKRSHRFPRHIHDSRKLKIGLIGGSFNPVHRGHLFIAKAALKFLNLDEVWWLVSLKNPFKSEKLMETYNERFENTLEKACHPRFKILSIEKSFGISSTSKLLKILLPRCPNMKFVWIMGADNLVNFNKWHNYKFILNSIPIAVFSRPGKFQNASYDFGQRFIGPRIKSDLLRKLVSFKPPIWGYIDVGRMKISSTEIRKQNYR